jgi:hypothetical protein
MRAHQVASRGEVVDEPELDRATDALGGEDAADPARTAVAPVPPPPLQRALVQLPRDQANQVSAVAVTAAAASTSAARLRTLST